MGVWGVILTFRPLKVRGKALAGLFLVALGALEFRAINVERRAQESDKAVLNENLSRIATAIDSRNLKSPSQIADAVVARLGELESQILESQRRLTAANADTRAELQRTQVQVAKDAPRSISPSQQEILKRELKVPEGHRYGVVLAYDMSCLDCNQFARQLNALFNGLPGWDSTIVMRAAYANVSSIPTGLTLSYVDREPSPSALAIARAFRAAGVSVNVVYNPNAVIVGPRPRLASEGEIVDQGVELRVDAKPG